MFISCIFPATFQLLQGLRMHIFYLRQTHMLRFVCFFLYFACFPRLINDCYVILLTYINEYNYSLYSLTYASFMMYFVLWNFCCDIPWLVVELILLFNCDILVCFDLFQWYFSWTEYFLLVDSRLSVACSSYWLGCSKCKVKIYSYFLQIV